MTGIGSTLDSCVQFDPSDVCYTNCVLILDGVQKEMDEARLKTIVRETVIEVLDERREYFSEIMRDVFEDMALLRAMEEADEEGEVSRDEIMKILRSEGPI